MQTTSTEKVQEYVEKGWWGNKTTTELFDEAVQAGPERCALSDSPNRLEFTSGKPTQLSYRELADAVDMLAARLHVMGVRQDDIVIVQLPNIVEVMGLYLAIIKIGAIISPVAMQYGAHELAHIIDTTNAGVYISTTNFKGRDYLSEHRSVIPDGTLLGAFGEAISGDVTNLTNPVCTEQQRASYETYLADMHVSANDIITLCWTSGTTGRPKGVPRSHNHWLAQGISPIDGLDIQQGDILLNPFPFVNMASFGGFFFPFLIQRCKLVLHHPFDMEVFLQQLQDEQITQTIAAPAILTMLLKQPDMLDQMEIPHLRVIGSGGAPLSPAMVKGFQDRYGIVVVNTFGSNEGCPLVSSGGDVPDPEMRAAYFPRFGVEGMEWENRVATMIRSRLMDTDTGEDITEPGKAGELLLAGATVFDGYYKATADNAEVFTEDGFFRTGDLLEIAEDDPRFYRFAGRCKDIIIRGGMKISPEELDSLLAGFDRVLEAAVVGYPDPVMEERIGVVVVPKPGQTITLEDVVNYMKSAKVAVFKLPERIAVVNELPRNPLGKVLRNELSAYFTA